MVTLWNPADQAQDFVFTLFFAGGHYAFPVHMEGRVTRTFNISEIVNSGIPDAQGNRIPPSVQEGSAELTGSKGESQHILVTMDAGTYNVRKATCAVHCFSCNGAVDFWIGANPWTAAVKKSTQLTFTSQYNTGTQYNLTNIGSWSSSNTNIATMDDGLIGCAAPGLADASASDNSEPLYWTGCLDLEECPQDEGGGAGDTGDCTASILFNGNDVTNTTTTVIIGEQIPLDASYFPSEGVSVDGQQWEIPGVPVGGFAASDAAGSYSGVGDTGSDSVTFYWTTPGTRPVTFSMTLSTGDILEATATFNCVAPTASITAVTSSVNVGTDALPFPGYGLYFNSNSGVPGITFSQAVSVPGGFSGATEWLQIVQSSSDARTSSAGTQHTNVPAGCLDTEYPYSPNSKASDTPAQPLQSAYYSYTRQDSFTMFLMFQPTGGIFVPVRLVNWSWGGTACMSPSTAPGCDERNWTLANANWIPNPSDAAPSGNPSWTCNAQDYINVWQ
jgi:hypothetical protein